MKNNDEMYKSLLSRWEEYQEKKKKRHLIIRRSIPIFACFCLIIILCLGYWKQFDKLPFIPENPDNIDVTVTDITESTVATTELNIETQTSNTTMVFTTVSSTVVSASATHAISVTSSSDAVSTTAVTVNNPVSSSVNINTGMTTTVTDAVTTTRAVQQGPGIYYTGSDVAKPVLTTTTDSAHNPCQLLRIKLCTSYYVQDMPCEVQYTEMKMMEPIRINNDYDPDLNLDSGIGILFEIDSPDYWITVSTNTGSLRWWDINKGSGPVVYLGSAYDVGNRGYIFWAPKQISSSENYENIIEIGGTDGNHGVSFGKIVITRNSDNTFSAVLKNYYDE